MLALCASASLSYFQRHNERSERRDSPFPKHLKASEDALFFRRIRQSLYHVFTPGDRHDGYLSLSVCLDQAWLAIRSAPGNTYTRYLPYPPFQISVIRGYDVDWIRWSALQKETKVKRDSRSLITIDVSIFLGIGSLFNTTYFCAFVPCPPSSHLHMYLYGHISTSPTARLLQFEALSGTSAPIFPVRPCSFDQYLQEV